MNKIAALCFVNFVHIRSIKSGEKDRLVIEYMSKYIHSLFYKYIDNNGLSKSLTVITFKSAVLKSEPETSLS